MIPDLPVDLYTASTVCTALAMFAFSASHARITNVRWWNAGLEMIGLGTLVALVPYASGAVVAAVISRS